MRVYITSTLNLNGLDSNGIERQQAAATAQGKEEMEKLCVQKRIWDENGEIEKKITGKVGQRSGVVCFVYL